MFSNQYIKMCIEAKDEIEYIRTSKEFQRGNELPIFSLKSGDFFHHPCDKIFTQYGPSQGKK